MYYNFFKVAKLTVFIIFGAASFLHVNAQDQRSIDSLINILRSTKDDKRAMEVKVELGWYYLNMNDELALKYSSEGFDLAMQYGDSSKIVRSGRVKGQALRRLDRLPESIRILSEVLPIAKRNRLQDDRKKILNALALAHTFMAEYDKALEYNFQSLVLREADGDKAAVSFTLNNIGLVYFKLHNYEGALKYYNQGLTLMQQTRDTSEIHTVYLNIGLCYLHLKKFKEAKDYTLKALELCGSNCSDEIIIMGEFGLGESSYHLGNLSDAEFHLNKSLTLARQKENQR